MPVRNSFRIRKSRGWLRFLSIVVVVINRSSNHATVRSGPWRLVANDHSSTEDRVPIGAAPVTLADHDIDDPQIRLEPLSSLTGTAEFKGGAPPGESHSAELSARQL